MFKEIYTAYAEHNDKTIILKDTIDDNGFPCHTEMIGFFYGSPDDEINREYMAELIEEYQ